MEEVIKFNEKYYIMVSSSLAEKQSRVLKHGETFAVFDRQGAIRPFRVGDQGIYHAGTRHLSVFQVKMAGKKPLYLSSMVKEDNDLLLVDSANPDFVAVGGATVKGDTLHLFQSCFLWDRCCYLRIRVSNFALEPVEFDLEAEFGADFHDIFEVRGMQRVARGRMPRPRGPPRHGAPGLPGAGRRLPQHHPAVRSRPGPAGTGAGRLPRPAAPARPCRVFHHRGLRLRGRAGAPAPPVRDGL